MQLALWGKRVGVLLLCVLLSLPMLPSAAHAAVTDNFNVTAGEEVVTFQDYEPGATITIRHVQGNAVAAVIPGTDTTGLTATVDLMPDPDYYYAVQSKGGIEGGATSFFNPRLKPPVLTSTTDELSIAGFPAGRTFNLYLNSPSELVNVTPTYDAVNQVYRYENLDPNSRGYYAVQTLGTVTSGGSNLLSPAARVPVATGGIEYVDVSNTYANATVKLYKSSDQSEVAITPTYNAAEQKWRFANVPAGYYYVVQTINNIQKTSAEADVMPDLPAPPSLTAKVESLEVSGILPNATLKLYTSKGGAPLVQYPTTGGATYTISNLLPHTDSYYVTQTLDGKESPNSNIVNPTLHIPTATAGEGYIEVTNVTPGATLHLYEANPSKKLDSAVAVEQVQGSGVYRFEDVVPRLKEYYVTQSLPNGIESENTEFLTSTLPNLSLTGGTDYIEVAGAYPNATLELYDSLGGLYSGTPPVAGTLAGTYRYNNIPEGQNYVARQTINGVVSEYSNKVNVGFPTPAAPISSSGDEQLTVSGYESGATLKLYVDGNPAPVATAPTVTTATYTFSEVLPNPAYYYVTQTVNGKESQNSEFVNPKLRIPAVTPILGAIEVRGVSANTVLKLRNAVTSALVSETPENLGGGVYRFNVTEPLAGAYYVTQSAGTIESQNSVFVNPILPKPTVTANGRTSIDVGNLYPGAALKLYNNANGREVSIQAVSAGNGVYRFENVSAGRYYVDQLVNGIPSPHSDVVEVRGPEIVINPSPVTPTPTPSPSTPNTPVDILVNGQIQKVGTLTSTTENGQTVQTIRVNSDFVRNLLNESASGAVVTIPFATASSDAKTVSELDDSLIRLMQSKNATLSLQTPIAEYRIPATSIRLASGGAQNDSNVRIAVAPASLEETRSIDSALSARTSKRISAPVNFRIVSSSGGTSVETDRFPNYVERLLPIPIPFDSGETVTAVVWDNGTARHVPTRIVTQNGVRYASVKSFGGETFALVAGRSSFGDIAGSWAQSAVEDMASRLIVQGTGSGSFEPGRSVNRAEFAAILAAGLGLSADNAAASGFADVSAGDWFSRDVAAAAQYGLINGFGDGTFRPGKTITRAEAMAMLARAMKVSGLGTASADASTLGAFADQADVPEWAREAAAANVQAGLIEGTEQQRLVPGANLSRAEAAALIRRLLAESGLI